MASWKSLPDVVFCDIMMMIGQYSLEDLHRCRQVSQSWNVMIAQITKYKKLTIWKKAESLASQFLNEEGELEFPEFPESLSKIVTAASLAHHGMLDSVKKIILRDVDLASVPAEHLASLTSCVTGLVDIMNVENCDMVSILDSVNCESLYIRKQNLNSEETWALVRAMESRAVEYVVLGLSGDESLDITALTQYSGQGKCTKMKICSYRKGLYRYWIQVESWAEAINWHVSEVIYGLQIQKPKLKRRKKF